MTVLSFRKSVDELDLAAEQLAAWQRLLARCVRTTSQYTVELKRSDLCALQSNLEALAKEAECLPDPERADAFHAAFRGEIRQYRDAARAEVERMRAELAGLMDSMQEFLTGVGGPTEDLKNTLTQEFAALEATAESGDIESIRGAIHHAVETAVRSFEEAQKVQELLTAQLQDELRNLHKVVDHERKAALTDPLTGLWNRGKLDGRIKDLILLNEGFCIFLVGIPSVMQLSQSDPRIWPELMKALGGRLRGIAGKDGELGMAGRWGEDAFAVVFNLPLSGAPFSALKIESNLGGDYAVQLDGHSHLIPVSVRVRAVERPKDFAESAFYLQLGQAAFQATAR